MDATKIGVVLALLIVIGVPFLFRPEEAAVPDNAERLIIITPHNEQICYEFGRGFSDWHEREHGTPVHVDWRTPGGDERDPQAARSLLHCRPTRGQDRP